MIVNSSFLKGCRNVSSVAILIVTLFFNVVAATHGMVEVSSSVATIYNSPKSNKEILSRTVKGDRFLSIDTVDNYAQILAWGQKGYIHVADISYSGNVNVIQQIQRKFTERRFLTSLGITTLVILLLIILISLRIKQHRTKRLHFRSALLVSEFPEEITMQTDNGRLISLKKYLHKRKTILVHVESVGVLRKFMVKHFPDLIFVDWRISSQITDQLQKLLKNYRLSAATTLVLYHAKDTSHVLDKTQFGDAEIIPFEHEPDQVRLEEIINGKKIKKNRSGDDDELYLSGVISGGNFPDVLQLIESTKKSGCIIVEVEEPFGIVFFRSGTVIYAANASGATGVEAIYAMLDLKDGLFQFKLDREPPVEQAPFSIMAVLMQWSERVDRETMKMMAISQ